MVTKKSNIEQHVSQEKSREKPNRENFTANQIDMFNCDSLLKLSGAIHSPLFQTGGDVLRFTTFAVATHHTKSEVDRPTIYIQRNLYGSNKSENRALATLTAQESPSPTQGLGGRVSEILSQCFTKNKDESPFSQSEMMSNCSGELLTCNICKTSTGKNVSTITVRFPEEPESSLKIHKAKLPSCK